MHVLLAGNFATALRSRLRELLVELGAGEILEVRSHEEAQAALRTVVFDLIVVDLRMSVPGGVDSLPQLRRRGRLCVPVVVILTFADPIQLVRARKLGVRPCQSTSVSLRGLRSAIDAALGTPSPYTSAGAGGMS